MIFNNKEITTTHIILDYFNKNESATIKCELEDGSIFTASFDTAYESENEVLDIEYLAILLRIKEVFTSNNPALRNGELFEIWYGNFPVKISDCAGAVIYEVLR